MGCQETGRMEESSQIKIINPKGLKRFVRHLCVIAHKYNNREKARADLQEQLQKLKRFSSKKKEMDEELKELNAKLSLVLEKELQLVGIKQDESIRSKELLTAINENKNKIDQIKESVNEIKERIRNYIEAKSEREIKIDRLEQKIKSQFLREKIDGLKKRLPS